MRLWMCTWIRLLELQIDEGLDLHVTPLEPLQRAIATSATRPFVPRLRKLTESRSAA